MMQWGERKLLLKQSQFPPWGKSSAMLPTPIKLSDDLIRVYTTFCDENNVGRVGYFDVNKSTPYEIINISKKPVLDIGEAGTFDDNGVAACSVVKVGNLLYMYYAGFEICTQIRYRILTGLAISYDNGETFQRQQTSPILDRTSDELFFRCGPFVRLEDDTFKMWYVGGSSWMRQDNKEMPVYDMRYMESTDGIHWPSRGKIIMPISENDEHGFGRPFVVKHQKTPHYQLYYSIRKISHQAYRLGYATSPDGIEWSREDEKMNLDVSSRGFDSQAIMFAAPITINTKTWVFYNGNGFGQDGIALIPLISNISTNEIGY